MFRARQSLPCAAAFPVVFTQLTTDEKGQTIQQEVNQSEVVLPDVETTNLANLLAAGIDPKQVNTRILKGSSIVTDLSIGEEENNNNNEEGDK